MALALHDELFAPEVIADPYTYFGRLRDADPIHWNETYQEWLITRHDDLVWFTRHHELFSSEVNQRDTRPPYPPIDAADVELNRAALAFGSHMFIRHDRPVHLQERMVVHGYFTPKFMETWRPLVQSAITQLLDQAEAKGEMDVMRDFATPLPLLVIAQMMGIPTQDRMFIREMSRKLLSGARAEPDRTRPAAAGRRALLEYLVPLVEERVRRPKDDLLSVLCEGERRGIYTRQDVLANAILLLIAGHETTINLICNGALAFIRHPDQWQLLQEDPAGRTVRATEECLRYDSPVKGIRRIAHEDVEVRGKPLHKGDVIRWVISAANRDPEVFDAPDQFDIQRYPNRHVAFGSGIHHCLGATLARLEGQEAFKALAERFDSLHLTVKEEELEYVPTLGFRSLIALPVTWH